MQYSEETLLKLNLVSDQFLKNKKEITLIAHLIMQDMYTISPRLKKELNIKILIIFLTKVLLKDWWKDHRDTISKILKIKNQSLVINISITQEEKAIRAIKAPVF